jgi:hypothetical protein
MLIEIYCAQTIRLPYKEWAENHIARIKGVLDGARAEHTQAVKDRIDAVGQMKDVVSLTEGLFAISKVRVPLSPLRDSSIIPCGFSVTGYCAARGGRVRAAPERRTRCGGQGCA